MVDFATTSCAEFRYDSAYVAPAFVCGDESLKDEAGEAIGPLAMRHPGMDVANNKTTSYFLGRKTRGARWVTFLSADLASQLNLSVLSEVADIRISHMEHGIRTMASEAPEIGDKTQQVDTPGLRAVAAALRPISFSGDHNLSRLLGGDRTRVTEWEKRFH
ncbi:MAG: type VI immunity family protein [Sandaracinaceae bacterium]